jgi:hypothetical protein
VQTPNNNRRVLRHRALIRALAAVALLQMSLFAASPSLAQGKLDARYAVSLAGLPIGKGAWVIDISQDQFTAAASGMTSGLLRVFSSGHGSAASRGVVRGGNLIPSSFGSSVTTDKTEELRMVLNGGNVKEYAVDPPPPPAPERVPLTDAHRRGVIDPMSAALIRVTNGEHLAPEACNRTLPIFDGRLRFDLKLEFKRMDQVKAEKGYRGPVVVCSVYFTPLAGHIPDRTVIKYLIAQRDMEMWLAPLSGTRVMVPFRISIPTPLGMGVLQATQFISAQHATRATPTSAQIQ